MWFYSVSPQAGIQNLRCSGWTVRETSSLLDLQRQSEVLMTSILSAAEWLWRRDTATASPVESNRTTPTRPERHTYMFQVDILSSVLVSKHTCAFFYTVYNPEHHDVCVLYISDNIFKAQFSSGTVIALAVSLALSLLTNVILWICFCRKR